MDCKIRQNRNHARLEMDSTIKNVFLHLVETHGRACNTDVHVVKAI